MDTLFTKSLHSFFRNDKGETTSSSTKFKKALSPYRTPTQKVDNNLFLGTLTGTRRNKCKR